jgi:hypothetical protein
MKIGIKAVQIAIAGFVIPYMAVYTPALMLQGDYTLAAVAYIVFKAVLSIGLWGAAAIGFLFGPLNMVERVLRRRRGLHAGRRDPAHRRDRLRHERGLRGLAWLRSRRRTAVSPAPTLSGN